MVGKRLANFRHDIVVYKASLGLQIRSALALRGAFITQSLGMVINNIGVIIAWLFMFERFGTLRGWSGAELIALQGINMLVFGVVMVMSVGILDLSKHVDQGSFDTFLTRPSSVISQVASSNVDVTTFGDVALGIVLTIWYMVHIDASLVSTLLLFMSMIVGCILFWCFVILLPNTLAFYMFDSERVTRYMAFAFLDGSLYPTGILSGPLRTILLTVFPALFIGAVQVDVLRGLHWWHVGMGVLVAAFWLPVSLWLFKRAVRRYESANLVGAR